MVSFLPRRIIFTSQENASLRKVSLKAKPSFT